MRDVTTLGSAIAAVAAEMLDRSLQLIPAVLGAVLLLVVGWILARVLRAVAQRAFVLLDALVTRMLPASGGRVRLGRSGGVLGAIVFWIVLLVFTTAATKVLGLETFATWLGRLLDNVPTLVAGAFIVGAGWVLSRFAGDLVLVAAVRVDPAQRVILARATQVAILTLAILVGADQVGLKVTLLVILLAAVAVPIVGGFTLAVSLGAREYVANLIGAHYLRQTFELGARIRVAGFEGRLLEVTATSVVLETDEGHVTLPGRLYNEAPIVFIAPGRSGG